MRGARILFSLIPSCARVAPPRGAVKLTSKVGGRNPVDRSAVGKLLLSQILVTRTELLDWLGGGQLEPKMFFALTDPDSLLAELHATRDRGYGVDDLENELRINCIAVPARSIDREPSRGLSASAS